MTKYLNNLTPLRGVAALLTVFFHFDLMLGNGGGGLIPTDLSFCFKRMYLMVDFFFILSGFIMCHVYGQLFLESLSWQNFKTFIKARLARIYPLHLLTLLFCIALFSLSAKMGIPQMSVLEAENNTFSIVTNLFLAQAFNLHEWFSWNHPAWSISVEWAAYLIFPILVVPFMKMSDWLKIGLILTCFLGYVGIAFHIEPIVTISSALPFPKGNPTYDTINVAFQYGVLRCLCGFILGMMMYEAYRAEWLKTWLSNSYTMLVLALLSFTAMHFNLPDYVSIIPFGFIILSGAYGSEGINRIFETTVLQRLGDWSFSIYMIHEPLLYLLTVIKIYQQQAAVVASGPLPMPKTSILDNWLSASWILALILVLSYLTYRFVEVPARKWINGR
jgi:peptidoglycan/LPS O-acetylase OafA/YrhL